MGRKMDGLVDTWYMENKVMDVRVDGWMAWWMDKWNGAQQDGRMGGWIAKWDEWIDGWIERWMDGQRELDGWMNNIHTTVCQCAAT